MFPETHSSSHCVSAVWQDWRSPLVAGLPSLLRIWNQHAQLHRLCKPQTVTPSSTTNDVIITEHFKERLTPFVIILYSISWRPTVVFVSVLIVTRRCSERSTVSYTGILEVSIHIHYGEEALNNHMKWWNFKEIRQIFRVYMFIQKY